MPSFSFGLLRIFEKKYEIQDLQVFIRTNIRVSNINWLINFLFRFESDFDLKF